MNPYLTLPRVPILRGRQALIVQKCAGKRVLHLGCVDAGLLHERFARGELMHQRLAAVAETLWGVDIDETGIAFLRQHGFGQLIAGDICTSETLEPLQGQPFDVIVASEVVEHLLNPGLFLASVRRLMIAGQTELIITVPNAFRIETLLWLRRGVEYVHPDHNYWFSYLTAGNLLRKTGFATTEVYVYSYQGGAAHAIPAVALPGESQAVVKPRIPVWKRAAGFIRFLPKRLLYSYLYSTTPFWGDGLIFVAQVAPDAEP